MAKPPILPLIAGVGALYFLSQKDKGKYGGSKDETPLPDVEPGEQPEEEPAPEVDGPLPAGEYEAAVGEKLTLSLPQAGTLTTTLKLNGVDVPFMDESNYVSEVRTDQYAETMDLEFSKPGKYEFNVDFINGPKAIWAFEIA